MELAILRYAIDRIGEAGQFSLVFHLTPFMHGYNVPRTSFYRSVNKLIEYGFILRVGRDRYILGSSFMQVVEVCEQWLD